MKNLIKGNEKMFISEFVICFVFILIMFLVMNTTRAMKVSSIDIIELRKRDMETNAQLIKYMKKMNLVTNDLLYLINIQKLLTDEDLEHLEYLKYIKEKQKDPTIMPTSDIWFNEIECDIVGMHKKSLEIISILTTSEKILEAKKDKK